MLPNFAYFREIQQRLAVQTPQSSPVLWTAAAHEAAETLGSAEPFYAFLWPGSYALCKLLIEKPHIAAGKAVLDFGAGCGAAGVAALKAGAAHVTLNDIDTAALSACSENLHQNMNSSACAEWHQRVTLCASDLLVSEVCAGGPPPLSLCDVLLCGDVFYDEDFARGVQAMLVRALQSGVDVYVADPGRPALPWAARDSLSGKAAGGGPQGPCTWEHIGTVQLPDNVQCVSNGHSECHVWRLLLR